MFSECSGELWRALSRRVTGSDLCFQIWPPWGENGLESVAGKAGSLVGRLVRGLEESRGVMAPGGGCWTVRNGWEGEMWGGEC